jgi:hypothetical protein
MFERLKRLISLGKTDKEAEPLQKIATVDNVVMNDLSVFETPEGQGRWALVLGAEGQGKTFLVREVAKRNGTFAYVEATTFQPTQDVDLFIIDDLHKAPKEKQTEIFNFLCGARHDNIKNIICVTQELKGIPSEVIRRFKVVAFFYSAKQHMKLQTIIKGGLKAASEMSDKILRLMPRTYFLYDVQSGFFKNPPFPNTETDLLKQAMQDVIPNKQERESDKNGKITLENGDNVDRENIKITPLIVKMLTEHPEYKYRYIAKRNRTTEDYVKKVASRLHRGLLKKYN